MFVYESEVFFGKITLTAVQAGKDFALVIEGGDKPHIGAVALAVPRKSLKDDNEISSTASVLTVTGHMEDLLARETALRVSKKLACTVTVSMGIHVENANHEHLEEITRLVRELVGEFLNDLMRI